MRQPDMILVFATLREAQPMIDLLAARECEAEPRQFEACVADQSLLIVIGGMGMTASARSMHLILDKYPDVRVMNCGIAGSLSGELQLGEILNVRNSRLMQDCRVRDGLHEISADNNHLPGLPSASLLTVDSPVFDAMQKQALAYVAELVDMEGGVIARICHHRKVSCQLLKVVSDFAEDRQQLHRNLKTVSELLAQRVIDGLYQFNQQYSPQQVAI